MVTAGDPRGTPVLLLHGFPEFWYGWRDQIPALGAANYRVIVPDQRGYNLSDKPRGVQSYQTEKLVRDVIGLLDHYRIEKVNLAGDDLGAAVAWSVAISFPGKSNAWNPECASPGCHAGYFTHFRQMLKSWYIGFFQIPGLPDWALRVNEYAAAGRLLVSSGKPGTFTLADLAEYKKAWAQPAR